MCCYFFMFFSWNIKHMVHKSTRARHFAKFLTVPKENKLPCICLKQCKAEFLRIYIYRISYKKKQDCIISVSVKLYLSRKTNSSNNRQPIIHIEWTIAFVWRGWCSQIRKIDTKNNEYYLFHPQTWSFVKYRVK